MKREVISEIIKKAQIQSEYLDKIRSIDCSLISAFDNQYVNLLIESNDTLLKLYLGEVLYNEVMWFLYDRPREEGGDEIVFDVGNMKKVYKIIDLESFLNYLEDNGEFNDKDDN